MQTLEPTQEKVNLAVNAILETLGKPGNIIQHQALQAFENGAYDKVKRFAATNLEDHYCKALSYLGGALKLTPNTDTILAESARAAAEVAKTRTLYELSSAIAKALS